MLYDTNTTELINIFTNFTCLNSAGTDLFDGIQLSKNHFEADNIHRDSTKYYKLVILSTCMDTSSAYCDKTIDVDAVNIEDTVNGNIIDPSTYSECITNDVYPISTTYFGTRYFSISNVQIAYGHTMSFNVMRH